MSLPDPVEFSAAWASAWNAHDLDAVLAHCHDDVVFTSPMAARLLPGSGGLLRGRVALRGYWAEGLRQIPDLHVTVERVYAGVNVLVISYRNHRGGLVDEVLRFSDGLVVEGHGTYLVGAESPAGAT